MRRPLTSYTVTRETLDGLVECGVIRFEHDYWYVDESRGDGIVAYDDVDDDFDIVHAALTHAILAEIEREGMLGSLSPEGWLLWNKEDHGPRFGIPTTLPEAFLAARRAQMEGKG